MIKKGTNKGFLETLFAPTLFEEFLLLKPTTQKVVSVVYYVYFNPFYSIDLVYVLCFNPSCVVVLGFLREKGEGFDFVLGTMVKIIVFSWIDLGLCCGF